MVLEVETRIHDILPSVLEQQDCYLVELKVRPGRVEVFADKYPHINVHDCEVISRSLIRQLNEVVPFSDHYHLEVSSPGMDQPFRVKEQYLKNVGREVEVSLVSGIKKSGRLVLADEVKISLEDISNKAEETITDIPFHQIKSTQLVIKF